MRNFVALGRRPVERGDDRGAVRLRHPRRASTIPARRATRRACCASAAWRWSGRPRRSRAGGRRTAPAATWCAWRSRTARTPRTCSRRSASRRWSSTPAARRSGRTTSPAGRFRTSWACAWTRSTRRSTGRARCRRMADEERALRGAGARSRCSTRANTASLRRGGARARARRSGARGERARAARPRDGARRVVRAARAPRTVRVEAVAGVTRALPRAHARAPRRASRSTEPWTASMDEGWTRWVLDQFGMRVHQRHRLVVRAGRLRDRFDVIVVPGPDAARRARGDVGARGAGRVRRRARRARARGAEGVRRGRRHASCCSTTRRRSRPARSACRCGSSPGGTHGGGGRRRGRGHDGAAGRGARDAAVRAGLDPSRAGRRRAPGRDRGHAGHGGGLLHELDDARRLAGRRRVA